MCCKKHILGYVKLKTTCRIQKTNLLFCSIFGKTSDGLFLFCFGQLKEIRTNRKKSKGELSCVWPTRKDLRFNNQRLLKLEKRRLKIKILKIGEKKKKDSFLRRSCSPLHTQPVRNTTSMFKNYYKSFLQSQAPTAVMP